MYFRSPWILCLCWNGVPNKQKNELIKHTVFFHSEGEAGQRFDILCSSLQAMCFFSIAERVESKIVGNAQSYGPEWLKPWMLRKWPKPICEPGGRNWCLYSSPGIPISFFSWQVSKYDPSVDQFPTPAMAKMQPGIAPQVAIKLQNRSIDSAVSTPFPLLIHVIFFHLL